MKHTEKTGCKKFRRASVSCALTSSSIVNIQLEPLKENRDRRGQKTILRHNGQKISKFDVNYKLGDARSSTNLKHKKNEENSTKAHYNQSAQNH